MSDLTKSDLADALDAFWNASIGAAHERQSSTAMDCASVIAEGFAAISAKLREPDPELPAVVLATPVSKSYRCGTCGSNDLQRYQRCQHAGCPDGRDR